MNLQRIFLIGIFVATCVSGMDILSYEVSASRDAIYTVVQTFLNQYKRPVTVLELNTIDGFFSQWISSDYDATCVVADRDNANELLTKYLKSRPENIVLLKLNMTSLDTHRLGECEHFDVVLMLNGLSYFLLWDEVGWNNLFSLGDHLIVRISKETDQKILDFFVSRQAQILFENDEYVIMVHTYYKKELNKGSWCSRSVYAPGSHVLHSSFEKKYLYKIGRGETEWCRGITLYTFKKLCGVYPTRCDITNMLLGFSGLCHNDLSLCNIIIQGQKLEPIDFDDPDHNLDPAIGLACCLNGFK